MGFADFGDDVVFEGDGEAASFDFDVDGGLHEVAEAVAACGDLGDAVVDDVFEGFFASGGGEA